MIEQMKEQCEREEREKQDETDAHKRESKELKERINTLLSELSEKEVSVMNYVFSLSRKPQQDILSFIYYLRHRRWTEVMFSPMYVCMFVCL